MDKPSEYMTVTEAREALGITKVQIARLIKDNELPAITNPLNRRAKMIRRADVDRLLALPRPPKRYPVAA